MFVALAKTTLTEVGAMEPAERDDLVQIMDDAINGLEKYDDKQAAKKQSQEEKGEPVTATALPRRWANGPRQ